MREYDANRLDVLFSRLAAEKRSGLGIFITAGDPNLETSLEILKSLPTAGADMIELGMPFSDPMADGPAIQASSQRSLKAGGSMVKTLEMIRFFRQNDQSTPIVLMGYYNPIYTYGVEKFLLDVIDAGVDGLIVVDLPPEEDLDLCLPSAKAGLPFIRLATPTTDDARLPAVLKNTAGFIYHVSIMGITGTQDVPTEMVSKAVARLKTKTDLPVAVGFGIKTPEHAAAVAQVADAVIVGSAVVTAIAGCLDDHGNPAPETTNSVVQLVSNLAAGVRGARVSNT